MLSDSRAVLIDFDAARQYRENDNSRDTVCLGTQGYAPPEQYGFSQTDQRSDIYSLGVLIKEISSHTPEFGLAPVLSKWYGLFHQTRDIRQSRHYIMICRKEGFLHSQLSR